MHVVLIIARAALIAAVAFAAWFVVALIVGVAAGKILKALGKGLGR